MLEQEPREEREPRRLGEVVDILLDVQRHLREDGFPEDGRNDEQDGRKRPEPEHEEQPDQRRVAVRERPEDVVDVGEEEPDTPHATYTPPPAGGGRDRRQLTAGERLAADLALELGIWEEVDIPDDHLPPLPQEREEAATEPPETESLDVRLFRLDKEIQAIVDEVGSEQTRLLQLDGMFTDWVGKIRALVIDRDG